MRILLITYMIMFGAILTACNDDVFIERPKVEVPDPEPEPDPDPDPTDSLVLKSLVYDMSTLAISDEDRIQTSESTFVNHTSSSGVTLLYDNYNSSLVHISNSTYYVTPWAKTGQPDIEVPGLDSIGVAGFYDTLIPFAFGTTVVRRQFMPGHEEHFDLPAYSKVTATIATTYRIVSANADIEYFERSHPSYLSDGRISVQVAVPVDIHVEWSEITPDK